MSKESKPTEEPTGEPTAEAPAVAPSPVDLAMGKVTESAAAVTTLTAQADALLAEFNTVAQASPVDTSKLLELARERDDIVGSADRPGKLARASAALAKARATLTDATWEVDAEKRDALITAFRAASPERPTLMPTPTIAILPLDDDGWTTAMADAEIAVEVAQWRVGLLTAALEARDLLGLGCDRIRVGFEKMGDEPQPVYSIRPVKTGASDVGKPTTRKPSANGGGKSRASYSVNGGAGVSARELADRYEPARSANVQSKIDGGASLSHTHLADSIMARLNKEGHTVTKSV